MADRDLIFTVLGIDKASRTFDNVGRSMDRLSSRATRALGGITAASAAASAGVAAALGGASAAFIGLGAVALRNNAEVKASFQDLSDTISDGLAQDAAPLADAFTGAADQIAASYEKLRPQMRQAFAASAPHVATLTSGVTGFAEQAMPGMVTAVQSADPVMEGFRQLMVDAGAGTRQFFNTVSQSSEQAGQAIQHFGQLARDGLPEIGGILNNLTSLWAEHGDQVVDVVTRMLGVINELSGSALPVLSAGVGTALDVLSGLLNVIEPLSGAIGPLIGLWLSLGTAMKGMRAVQGVITNVSGTVTNFADASRRAGSTRGVGALRGAGRGLMGMLGGPFGLAVAGATAALAAFGSQSQQASQDQKKLADALRESGGEFDANARKTLMNSQSYQEWSGTIDELGLSHEKVLDGIVQGGSAYDNLRAKVKDLATAETQGANAMSASSRGLDQQTEAAQDLLGGLSGLRGQVQGATEDFNTQQEAIDSSGEAMVGSVPGADALTKAMKTLKNETASTSDHVDALNTAWKQLHGVQITQKEAIANFQSGLASLQKSLSGVKQDTNNWRSALFTAKGEINLTTEAGRTFLDNLTNQGEAYRRLAQTAYDTTLRRTKSQQKATQAAVTASKKRRGQFINEMQAMGFARDTAIDLANQYLGLPNDILTQIRADANPAQAAINRLVRVNDGRVIDVNINAVAQLGPMLGMSPFAGFANGGLVGFPRGGMLQGRGGPRSDSNVIAASDGEFLVNSQATRQNLDLLRAINSGAVSSGDARAASGGARAVMPSGGGGSPTVTVRFDTTGADEGMKQLLRKIVRVDGHGDVQVALGS